MRRISSFRCPTVNVSRDIDESAYDNIKIIIDNLESILACGDNIDKIEQIIALIEELKQILEYIQSNPGKVIVDAARYREEPVLAADLVTFYTRGNAENADIYLNGVLLSPTEDYMVEAIDSPEATSKVTLAVKASEQDKIVVLSGNPEYIPAKVTFEGYAIHEIPTIVPLSNIIRTQLDASSASVYINGILLTPNIDYVVRSSDEPGYTSEIVLEEQVSATDECLVLGSNPNPAYPYNKEIYEIKEEGITKFPYIGEYPEVFRNGLLATEGIEYVDDTKNIIFANPLNIGDIVTIITR
jgi:hypothetical protein